MKILYLLLCCMPSVICKPAEGERFNETRKPITDNKIIEERQNAFKKPYEGTMHHFQPDREIENNQRESKAQSKVNIESLAGDLYKDLSQERKQKFINKFDNLKGIDPRIQDLILGNIPENIDDTLITKIKAEIKKEEGYSRFIGNKRSQHFIDALKDALTKAENSVNKKENPLKPKMQDQAAQKERNQQKLDNKQEEERAKAKKRGNSGLSISFDQPSQPTKPTETTKNEKATEKLLKNLIFNTEPIYKIKASDGQGFDIVTKEAYDQSNAFPIVKRTYQDKYSYSSVKIKEYKNPLEDNPDIKKLEQSLQDNNPSERKKAFKSFIDTLNDLREINLKETEKINKEITLLKHGPDGKSPKTNLTNEEEKQLNDLNEKENKAKALTSFIDTKINDINKTYPKLKKAYDDSISKKPKQETTPKVDTTNPTKPQEKTPEEKLQDLESERYNLAKERETLKNTKTTLESKLKQEKATLSQIGSASTPKNEAERANVTQTITKLQSDIKSIDQKINANTTKTNSLSQKIEDMTDNKDKSDVNDEPVDYSGSAW